VGRRNVTVQLDDDVIHRAKVLAAKRGTSLSALVANELERIVEADDRYEEAWRRAEKVLDNATPRGGRRWRREDLYDG
jgi:hypothetical protein